MKRKTIKYYMFSLNSQKSLWKSQQEKNLHICLLNCWTFAFSAFGWCTITQANASSKYVTFCWTREKPFEINTKTVEFNISQINTIGTFQCFSFTNISLTKISCTQDSIWASTKFVLFAAISASTTYADSFFSRSLLFTPPLWAVKMCSWMNASSLPLHILLSRSHAISLVGRTSHTYLVLYVRRSLCVNEWYLWRSTRANIHAFNYYCRW